MTSQPHPTLGLQIQLMAVAPMLLQFIRTITTFVSATSHRALIREHTAVLLRVAHHVGLAGESLGASSAGPARATVGFGHSARSGWREGAAGGRRGVGRWNSKGCGMVVVGMGHLNGGRGVSVRRVGNAVGVASRVGAIRVLVIIVAYKRRSGRREGAAHGSCGARRRRTVGGNISGIAVVARGSPNGGSGGVVRRVRIDVGVTIRIGTITVMEIMAAYGASRGNREIAAHGRRGPGELSTKRGSVCGIATATMGTPHGGAVMRRVEIGVGVTGRVNTIAVLKRKSGREPLIVRYVRGRDVAESVTIVIGAIASVVNGTADTAGEVDVRIGSDFSSLNGTIDEARSSDVVVRIEAAIDVIDA